jgi:uncharacterized protein (TIGR02145 family)
MRKIRWSVNITAAAAIAALCSTGCSKKPEREPVPMTPDTSAVTPDTLSETSYTLSVTYDTLTDKRDGKTYRTVRMPDGKTWTAENLNYQAGKSRCYGDKEPNCKKFGRLYDWKTAKTVCPTGWRLPSKGEWDTLFLVCGENKAGKALKSKDGWNWYYDEDVSGGGTDTYGFSALPGGQFHRTAFISAGNDGYWWTATETSDDEAYSLYMMYSSDMAWTIDNDKDWFYSVRCVKNK